MSLFRTLIFILPSMMSCIANESATSATLIASRTTSPVRLVPALDLSTAEKARMTIYEVLKRGDKEEFKKCVTKRILDRRDRRMDFDAWYAVWKDETKDGPEKFKAITVRDEEGQFKLDEN